MATAKMKRVALVVLDGLGIGWQADAEKYGDVGANTLGHVIEKENPDIPNLTEMGLLTAAGIHTAEEDEPIGCYGVMEEAAAGKDTTTGHWELAGLTLKTPFPTYPNGFPKDLMDRIEQETGFETLGNKPASGTEILKELGAEHLRTGKPIVYTSADSVFQIAAHEGVIPVTELWHICRTVRRLLKGEHAVGRVIARPFVGEVGSFARTENRRDFSIDPVGTTMLDVLSQENYDVLGVGKIEDIFNHRGLTQSNHAAGNEACMDALLDYLKKDHWRGLVFANFGDTDSLYGHRNDAAGYARCLEAFDRRLPEILRLLGEDGMLIITADHGCDPCDVSTDHTRERVPVLVWSLGLREGVNLGCRRTFADVCGTILQALGAQKRLDGESFLNKMLP